MIATAETKLPVLGTNGYPLQDAAVYGPIRSRRFGNSLGINPLPLTYKFCDFDCVYCQYGWTPRTLNPTDSKAVESSAQTRLRAPRPGNSAKSAKQNGGSAGLLGGKTSEKLKPVSELLSEIETSFQKFVRAKTQIDVITIAGNGEPTLYPDFPKLVSGLIELRDRHFPNAPVGILSDSSQCHRSEIKRALEMLDERCMKLDAGEMKTIEEINKPAGGFDLKRTLDSLRDLPDIIIQAMFVQGSYDNTKPGQIEKWIEAVRFVNPRSVQVYTIDRPPADGNIQMVSESRLEEIAQLCQAKTGILTEVFD